MKSKLDLLKAANPTLELQFKLRDISKFNSDIPSVFPTGKFDTQTQAAVSEFQKMYDLPITGTVDFNTWNEINKEHRNCMHCKNPPRSSAMFPNSMHEYKLGDSNNVIYVLQIILKNYHKRYKNYPDVELTGAFDEQTEKALKQFQKCSKLPVTGILDRRTWNTLNQIHEICHLCQ